MSFQAYINNIKAKTGKDPADFRKLAEQKGFTQHGELKAGIKAGDVVKWLKDDFELGHGHAMAIYALLKGIKTRTVNKICYSAGSFRFILLDASNSSPIPIGTNKHRIFFIF